MADTGMQNNETVNEVSTATQSDNNREQSNKHLVRAVVLEFPTIFYENNQTLVCIACADTVNPIDPYSYLLAVCLIIPPAESR